MAVLAPRSEAEAAAIERAWRRIEPLALYPRPLDTGRMRIRRVAWLFRLPWFRRFDGYTIWSLVLLRDPLDAVSEALIAHEAVHVWQGQHEWVRLWVSYIRPSTFWGDRSGYYENPYEVEARDAVRRTEPGAVTARP